MLNRRTSSAYFTLQVRVPGGWPAPTASYPVNKPQGAPLLAVFSQGAGVWTVTAFYSHYDYHPSMPEGLKRYYGTGHLHFITCSCYQRTTAP